MVDDCIDAVPRRSTLALGSPMRIPIPDASAPAIDRAACAGALFLCALTACSTIGTDSGAESNQLVIRGVVTAIFPTNALDVAWGIKVRVETVEKGIYNQPDFTFSVHSPAMSGLVVGEHYTIVALASKKGYRIDDSQWRDRHEAKW
jgi:hypothetical protein